MKKRNVAAIILARGGSKSLPKKNILPLLGKPLIQYTLGPLKKTKLVDRIIVSTDDEKIAEISRNLGAETPFLRPAELSGDYVSTEETLQQGLLWLKENEGYTVDILVFLQVTDLFKKSEWIDGAIKMLLEDDSLESVFVAYPEHKNYWKQEDNGEYVRLTPGTHMPRQLKKHIYREDTGLGCATRAHLIEKYKRRLGDKVRIIENPDFTIDIHSEFDLWLAEKILQERPEYKIYLTEIE
jgi:CMP-N-acetylneuraminic acid synthetase